MQTIINIPTALQSLRPNAGWVLRGDTYEGLEWLDSTQELPSESEVEAEIERLQTLHDNQEYQRLRAKAYPSIQDQLDILYHEGFDIWKQKIEEIKLQYPKTQISLDNSVNM